VVVIMRYSVEVFDRAGLRVGRFDEVPLLEVARAAPDGMDRIEGLLPVSLQRFGVGYTVRVSLEGLVAASATVTEARPAWGDTRRLILDRYVEFQELLSFTAERDYGPENRRVARSYKNQRVDAMVRDVINSALGPVHYTVAHGGYPDGAEREHAKFMVRQANTDALEIGGIETGQWVDSSRIDLTGAEAKDGDTISGLVVDGVAWPDLRLMMIDCEETSLNSHAINRHPEIVDWTTLQYSQSVYKRRADAAKARLQELLDTHGIDYIELNPHQDASGAYDDRVDAYGRYLGLVYGGGECFNAAMVEEGHADVYLYADGRYHVPELALKEFYSYTAAFEDSVEACSTLVGAFEARGGALEVLTALAALGDGYVFHVDNQGAVHFRRGDRVDHVVTLDPVRNGVELGHDLRSLVNLLRIQGDPMYGGVDDYHAEDDSIDAFGSAFRFFAYFALTQADDAERLGAGLLRDLAWPARAGRAVFHRGLAEIQVGELLEFRGEAIVERDAPLSGVWGEELGDRIVGRVNRVVHRIAGESVETRLDLTSPFRSVANPLSFITRSQDSLSAFFQFRLDDASIGVDTGFHLD
jgi:endonuclease YncB( thermonuclease family)